jgi:alpha-galactosidase
LPGQVHSNGYTYFRDTSSGHVLFLGSLSEQVSYTYFKANLLEGKLSIYKDIQGKALAKGESAVFKFLVSQRENTSELKSIWNLYANYYDPNKQFNQPRHLTGWSSWYNTYERITEKDVVDNLNAFKKYNYPIDVFQVDDGFEAQIGDWLDINSVKFPRGMKELAADISKQGYIPGIWMAPYAVGFKSKIVKQHPEWLLKHPDGSLVVAGPNWGGFYAVDIYHPEACGYLENVFNTFIDDWGYGLLKLDFIFAAAMIPRLGKTRGEIMWDAVDLLTKWTNKRALLLGSGVTLPSVWGKFEYSRVSSDASPWWDDSILRMSSVRERVSSANAMTSTINRWAMGQSIFGSDPDVFFIRSDNNKLTKEEKFSLLNVNIVMGQLILMSDNVDRYSKEEHRLYASTFPKPKAQVQDVSTIGNDIYQVEYTCDGRSYLFISNLSPLPYTAHLPIGGEHRVHYFEHTNVLVNSRIDWLAPQSQVFLKPHETRSFMRVVSYPEDRFMGSTGHIVPGAEIESITEEKQDVIHITFRKNRALKKQKIYLSLKSNESPLPRVYVDGELAKRIEKRVWDEHVSVAKVSVYETA